MAARQIPPGGPVMGRRKISPGSGIVTSSLTLHGQPILRHVSESTSRRAPRLITRPCDNKYNNRGYERDEPEAGERAHADCRSAAAVLLAARAAAGRGGPAVARRAVLGLPRLDRTDQEVRRCAVADGLGHPGRGPADRIRVLRARGSQGPRRRPLRLAPLFTA